MKRRRQSTITALMGPVGRAVVAKQWSAIGLDAQIHALTGADPAALLNHAGRIFYVVLGAALRQGLDPEQLELRIVRGAVNAMGGDETQPHNRAAIGTGLEAAKKLAAMVPQRVLVDVYIELVQELKTEHVNFGDFKRLLGANQ